MSDWNCQPGKLCAVRGFEQTRFSLWIHCLTNVNLENKFPNSEMHLWVIVKN